MKIALIPPTDITPEAAVVSYPKPIHTNANPLNRAPQGLLYNQDLAIIQNVEIFQL